MDSGITKHFCYRVDGIYDSLDVRMSRHRDLRKHPRVLIDLTSSNIWKRDSEIGKTKCSASHPTPPLGLGLGFRHSSPIAGGRGGHGNGKLPG